MFYLHASNRTENLLEHLAGLIEAAPQESIFTPEYLIIQSQGMERMINQHLARHFTSWCNYRFLLPVAFLQEIAAKLHLEIAPDAYERSFLTWRIEEKLRRIEAPVYGPLQRYLQGDQAALKRYQLARQLANLFDQYQLMRPRLLRQWEAGRLTGAGEAETWQMHLWHRLSRDSHAGSHRGELLRRVIECLDAPVVEGLPRRVSLFGLDTLAPFFLTCLRALAVHCDIHLFLLSPCQRYWGDLQRSGGDTSVAHPLLASLGQQGRDFQEMLLGGVDFAAEFISYADPASDPDRSLLHRLQADMLSGTVADSDFTWRADDKSIRLVSCHSRRRELEVLKDHVIHLLEEDQGLQLRDIVVMAPDIQEYAPFIPAVFADIQHSIADRSLFRTNSYIAVFTDFLELLESRFGWSEVVDLLEKEPVRKGFDLARTDFELLRHWVQAAGIRWGLSAASRSEEGAAFAQNSWTSGVGRLLMGYAVDSREPVAGIYPCAEVEGGDAAILGALCRFVELLERGHREWRQEYDLLHWSSLLAEYANELFGRSEEREFLELQAVIRQLADYHRFHGGEVSGQVIQRWFAGNTVEARSASGFLRGCLTFCSMLPMRAIPFAAVCLVGLDYTEFPASDRYLTFDLMRLSPKLGDRSRRVDDRYQFLEVLLSARRSLYLSYRGQSLQTGDELPPSVVVAELLEVMENCYGVDRERLVEVHPLYSFSGRYFQADEPLFSYSERDLEIARKMAAPPAGGRCWWTGTAAEAGTEIPLDELMRFFAHPQEFFLRHTLGVELADEAVAADTTELFRSEGLQAWSVAQQILANELEAGDPGQLRRLLQEDGEWPLEMPGEVLYADNRRAVSRFAELVRSREMGARTADVEIDLRLGPYRLRGRLTDNYQEGTFLVRYGALRARDLLKGWLQHLVLSQALAAVHRTEILRRDALVVFAPVEDGQAALAELIEVYVDGMRRPSRLLAEPALEYCRRVTGKRSSTSPLAKARESYRRSLESGYEPAWSLVFAGRNVEEIVDEEFAGLAERLLLPLWRMVA